jgi:repressor LexA
MSPSLTARQQEILDWIAAYTHAHARPPTRADLCAAFGFRSPNAAETHLRALERRGAITIASGRSRGIRLLMDAPGVRPGARTALPRAALRPGAGLPLIGRVAAGSPILASENIEDDIAVDRALFKPRADFLLRVRGDSMRDAGILDGDLLAVHKTATALPKSIVVARIEDEVTVKYFEAHGSKVRLLAANPDYKPIEVDLSRQGFVIEGLAVGVLRQLGVKGS